MTEEFRKWVAEKMNATGEDSRIGPASAVAEFWTRALLEEIERVAERVRSNALCVHEGFYEIKRRFGIDCPKPVLDRQKG